MASQGPLYPGTAASEIGPSGDDNWVNASNIGSDNDVQATITAATFDAGDDSYRLKATNFGFSIPTGATVDGIVVEIQRSNAAGASSDSEVRLYDSTSTLVGSNKAAAGDWATALTTATYGTSTDTWAAGLDDADINSANFGVALIVNADAANTDIGVDFIRVTVYYSGGTIDLAPTPVAVTLAVPAPLLAVDQTLTPTPVAVVLTLTPVAVRTAALVVGNSAGLTSGDTAVQNRLIAQNFTVTAIDDGAAAATGYDIVVVAESCAAATVGTKYNTSASPVLILEPGIVGEMDFGADGNSSGTPTDDNVVILDDTHPMAAGFTGTVNVQPSAIRMDFISDSFLPAAAVKVYSVENLSTSIAGVAIEEGETIGAGHVLEARRAYVSLFHDAGIGTVTANGFALLDAAIQWVVAQPSAGAIDLAPTPVAVTLAVPAPAIATELFLTPVSVVAVTAVTAVANPSVYTLAPAPVAAVTGVPVPSIDTPLSLQPAAVAAVLAVPAPALATELALAPAPVAAVLTVPASDVSIGGAITLSPVPVAAVLTVPAPVFESIYTLAPAAVAAVTGIPAPSIATPLSLQPAAVAAVLAVPAPAIATTLALLPAPVAAVLTVPASVFGTVLAFAPAAVPALLAVPAPLISTPLSLQPAPVAAVLSVGISALTFPIVFSPSPIPVQLVVTSSQLVVETVAGDVLLLLSDRGKPRWPWMGRGLQKVR